MDATGQPEQLADVPALLARVPGWAGTARSVGLLGGGITNRNVLVEVGPERFVLRLAGKDTELLEIRRHDEVVAARRAAMLGFGPEVVAFLEPEGFLVTRFVDGETLEAARLQEGAVIRVVAGMLRAIHAQPPLNGTFDAFEVPALHLAAARARGVAVPERYEGCAAIATRIAGAFAASPEPMVPAHNDLLPANFLAAPDGRLWLLDWEYAGNNHRYFDLGNLAVNNEFTADHEEALVAEYFGAVTPRRLARLRLMRLMSDLREAMWGVVQQGISELDFDYVEYADRHFDRLVATAGTVDLGRLLDAAATGPPDGVRPGS